MGTENSEHNNTRNCYRWKSQNRSAVCIYFYHFFYYRRVRYVYTLVYYVYYQVSGNNSFSRFTVYNILGFACVYRYVITCIVKRLRTACLPSLYSINFHNNIPFCNNATRSSSNYPCRVHKTYTREFYDGRLLRALSYNNGKTRPTNTCACKL